MLQILNTYMCNESLTTPFCHQSLLYLIRVKNNTAENVHHLQQTREIISTHAQIHKPISDYMGVTHNKR